MTLEAAVEDLRTIINNKHGHAALFRAHDGSYYAELHAGFAGNCVHCNHHEQVWREDDNHTCDEELHELLASGGRW